MPKRAWILLTRVKVGTKTEDIISCLNGKPDMEQRTFEVTEMPTDREDAKVFRVGADYALRDQLYDAKLWPRGVRVRRYFWKRDNDGRDRPGNFPRVQAENLPT